SYELLNKNGVFVLFSSCAPINKKSFAEKYTSEIFEKGIFYVPYNVELEGSKNFNGKLYMAQRNFEHWKNILKLVKETGFEIKMFKYEMDTIFSKIYIAAIKNK